MNRLTRVLATLSLAVVAATGAACASTGGQASPEGKLVLVAGATGGTGQEAVKQALAQGYAVRVLVRNAEAARPLLGDKVQYAVGNVRDTAAVAKAFKGVTYVISALGSNSQRDPENKPEFIDYGGTRNLAEAAKAAGVKQFVLVSSIGVTHADHPLNKMFDNIMSWKLKGEDALRASGVPYTVVRPGGLANDPAGKTALVASQGDTVSTGRIARADVAAICVAALGKASALGKTFEVIGADGTPPSDWNAFFAGLRADAR
ncbi:MAG: SDR family oxidoreductase [Steroidobacteraceae bacterium]